MKITTFLILSIIFIFPFELYSQQNDKFYLEGTLCDNSGKAIDYATIAIRSQADSTYISGCISDENGKFRINDLPSKAYILSITHLLYKRKFIEIDIQTNINLPPIVLNENITELNAVVVTANSIQHKGDRYIVSLQNNPITKGNNTAELLGLMPGVTNEKGNLKIHGRDVSQIYIDGRRIRDRKELEAIQAENLDKVEVVYMTGSIEDAASMGGIINIKLKKTVNGGYYGSISGNYSVLAEDGHRSDNINSSFNYRYNKLSIYNYVSYDDFKNIDKYDIKSYYKDIDQFIKMRTKDNGWTHSFSDRLSLTYDLNNKHSIGANLRISVQNGSPIQSSNSTVTDSQNNIIDLTGSSIKREMKNNQYQAALNYNWLIDEKGSNFKLIADYLRYDNRVTRNNAYQYDIDTENEYFRYSFDNIDDKTDMLEVDAKLELKFKESGQLDFGLNYDLYKSAQLLKYQNLMDDEWIEDKALSDNYGLEGNNYAGYVSFSSIIREKLAYKIGARVQNNQIKYNSIKIGKQNSKSYLGFYPSIDVMYNIDSKKGTVLSFAYQRAMDPIPYNTISPVIIYNNENSYTKGNLDIKPINYNILSLNFVLNNDWNFYYMFLFGDGMIYYKTFIDEENPLVTYTMPINGNKVYWHSLGADRTFKVNKYWNLKINNRIERPIYKGTKENNEDVKTWKYYLGIDNNFKLDYDWGGNLSFYIEPTFESQDRTYKTVHRLSGSLYKYILDKKLLFRLNYTIYARNRTLTINRSDYMWDRKFITNQTGFSLNITYNFNGGKKVTTKQAKSIQNYYEYKDN